MMLDVWRLFDATGQVDSGWLISHVMAAVHEWVRWNRRRIVDGFLLKRPFMLPRYPRQFNPSSVPNPSLYPCVLDILVRPRIDVGKAHTGAFLTRGFVLYSFPLLRYLIDELVVWN
jgi:hypothetical protein